MWLTSPGTLEVASWFIILVWCQIKNLYVYWYRTWSLVETNGNFSPEITRDYTWDSQRNNSAEDKKIANHTRKGITMWARQQMQLGGEITPQELKIVELAKIDLILTIFNVLKEKKKGKSPQNNRRVWKMNWEIRKRTKNFWEISIGMKTQ